MLIVYNGPHPEVVVDEFDQEQVITAGKPVDIPDDIAARLLEQNTWAANETAAQRKAREKAEKDAAEAAAAEAAATDTITEGSS